MLSLHHCYSVINYVIVVDYFVILYVMSTAYTHWLSYEEFVESYSVLAPSRGSSAQRRKTREMTEVGEASIRGVGSVAIVLCVCAVHRS